MVLPLRPFLSAPELIHGEQDWAPERSKTCWGAWLEADIQLLTGFCCDVQLLGLPFPT